MKKLRIAIVLTCFPMILLAQETIHVHFMNRAPFLYENEQGKLQGLEYDILIEFKNWLQTSQDINIEYAFTPHQDFSTFLNAIKKGKQNVLGAGTVTYNASRNTYLNFSGPYLNNYSLLVSKQKFSDINQAYLLSKAATIYVTEASVHFERMQQHANINPNLNLSAVNSQTSIPDSLIKHAQAFGWMDLAYFWHFAKQHPEQKLHMYRELMVSEESFQFVTPKISTWHNYLRVFFTDGFGFTSTKKYHQIVSKYLGEEVLPFIEVQP